MAKTEVLNVRITPELKAKLSGVAKDWNRTISEILIDYIKGLPEPKS